MARIKLQAVPDEYYSIEDVDRLLKALVDRMNAEAVMHAKEVAAFLGVSERTVFRSELPFHKVKGLGRVYLRSEIIEYIKKH